MNGRPTTLLGRGIASIQPVTGGYTHADRGIATLEGGDKVFYKRATDALTARWLRDEWRIYSRLDAPYLADVLEWTDGERPLLVLEALPPEGFPPPWTTAQVERARDLLRAIAATPPPDGLPKLVDGPLGCRGWAEVADDPALLLASGFSGARWLEDHLPSIVAVEASLERDGDQLVHHDFRSDNVCLAERSVVIDWNWACVGNPDLDVAFWSPSLHLEGGPAPWELLPARPDLAAAVSGFFSSREAVRGLPEKVRAFQRAQRRIAVRWLCHALELPTPS